MPTGNDSGIKILPMDNFREWLQREMDERLWQQADLAKQARISTSNLSRVMNGLRQPGPEFCTSIAAALGYPPEQVFREAGLLPKLTGPEDKKSLDEMIEIARMLTLEQREDAIRYIRFLLQQKIGAANPKKDPAPDTE